MAGLSERYRVNETNIALRRIFMRLGERDIAVLAKLAPWSQKAAAPIARAFYDHQVAFAPTRRFFSDHAARLGCSLDQLREALERAQGASFRQIFEEAASGGGFGVAYFEQRLTVGCTHNAIDLPFKWYLGSYPMYFDLVRSHT